MAVTGSHFRFGVDELAESTHTWYANEDTNPAAGVIPMDIVFLLRFTEQCDATLASNEAATFQYNKNAAGWVTITTTSSVVKALAAVALTNGGNCTKRLSGTGTFETTGAGQTETGASGGNANDIVASGNSETECGLQVISADVALGDSIQFRITGSPTAITMSVTPTFTVGSIAKSATDSTRIGLSDTAAMNRLGDATDAFRIGMSETGTADTGAEAVTLSGTDSATLGLSETVDALLASLSTSDVSAAGLSAIVDRLLAALTPNESAGVGATDTLDALAVRPEATDSFRAGLLDATSLLAAIDPAGESATLGLTEATSLGFMVAASEALAAVVAEQTATQAGLSDVDAIRAALAEALDALAVRREASETVPLGMADAVGQFLAELDDADLLRVVAGDALDVVVTFDDGETLPVVLTLEGDGVLVGVGTDTESLRIVIGGLGDAVPGGGGGGGGVRSVVRLSWPHQNESAGGPP